MSKRTDMSLSALPGFEDTITPCRPGEADLSDEKRYTGEVLFREHPDVFKAVAAAFFIDGLSIRATAARYRVSVNSVRAIRDMALESWPTDAGRAALFIKSKADRLRGIVRTRALEVLYDRLADPKTAKNISVDALLRIVETDSHAGEESKNTIPASAEIINIDEFDDVVNGLEREKNSAPPDGPEVTGENVEKCSTSNTQNDVSSFELSNADAENKGVSKSVCNSLCNSHESGSNESRLDDADLTPPSSTGGGGDPRGQRAGESK